MPMMQMAHCERHPKPCRLSFLGGIAGPLIVAAIFAWLEWSYFPAKRKAAQARRESALQARLNLDQYVEDLRTQDTLRRCVPAAWTPTNGNGTISGGFQLDPAEALRLSVVPTQGDTE